MCVVRRMFGAQVCSVVRWLFGSGFVGLLVVLIVPLFLSFLAMPGLCCFLRLTPNMNIHTSYNESDVTMRAGCVFPFWLCNLDDHELTAPPQRTVGLGSESIRNMRQPNA